MLETMYAAPGVGLAAPQVGTPLRICVIDIRPDNKKRPIVLINPCITEKSGKMVGDEGCLSLPGLNAEVKRYKKIKVEAINERGFPIAFIGEDYFSRVLQHEIEHLDGKLYIDTLSSSEKKRLDQEVKRKKKQGEW
jgi:peptide deformylase